MTRTWSAEELERVASARELEIATRRADGTRRRWTPIWVVRVGDDAYVRTWYRRDTGWYGDVLRAPHARILVPGLETDVVVEDVGASDAALRAAIDAAYAAKYGGGNVGGTTGDEAGVSTLRLVPG